MTFDNTKAYTIQCRSAQNQIQLNAVKPVENWFKAKVISQQLSDFLQNQFNVVDQCIKSRNFKEAKRVEHEIFSQGFQIKESGQSVSEIQLGKKNTIYFKIH